MDNVSAEGVNSHLFTPLVSPPPPFFYPHILPLTLGLFSYSASLCLLIPRVSLPLCPPRHLLSSILHAYIPSPPWLQAPAHLMKCVCFINTQFLYYALSQLPSPFSSSLTHAPRIVNIFHFFIWLCLLPLPFSSHPASPSLFPLYPTLSLMFQSVAAISGLLMSTCGLSHVMSVSILVIWHPLLARHFSLPHPLCSPHSLSLTSPNLSPFSPPGDGYQLAGLLPPSPACRDRGEGRDGACAHPSCPGGTGQEHAQCALPTSQPHQENPSSGCWVGHSLDQELGRRFHLVEEISYPGEFVLVDLPMLVISYL